VLVLPILCRITIFIISVAVNKVAITGRRKSSEKDADYFSWLCIVFFRDYVANLKKPFIREIVSVSRGRIRLDNQYIRVYMVILVQAVHRICVPDTAGTNLRIIENISLCFTE